MMLKIPKKLLDIFFLEVIRVSLDKHLDLTPVGPRLTTSLSAHVGDAVCSQSNQRDPKMARLTKYMPSHRNHTRLIPTDTHGNIKVSHAV